MTVRAMLYQGIACAEMKNFPEANTTVEKLRQLIETALGKKDKRYYLFLKGYIALKQEHISQAIDLFEMAYNLLPDQMFQYDEHAFFLEPLVESWRKRNDLEKAKMYAEKISALSTGRYQWGDIYAKNFFYLGKIYQKKGQNKDAIHNFEQFISLWEDTEIFGREKEEATRQLALLKKTATQ